MSPELGPVFSTYTKGGVYKWNPIKASEAPENVFNMQDFTSRCAEGANRNRGGYYGWMGYGGSIFNWDLQHKISFAFIPTNIYRMDGVAMRAGLM